MTVCVTIEASLQQFIGAVVQFLSFRDCATPITYCLCIVSRDQNTATQFVRAAAACGMRASTAAADGWNPYLNKWCSLEQGHLTAEAAAMLLDWDVFNSQGDELPVCHGSIGARLNPPDLYRDLIAISPTARNVSGEGDVPSSINGGVLVSTAARLQRCGAHTKSLVNALRAELPSTPAWKVEQFALSITAGKLGLTPLPNPWNVTPVSPVDDSEVALFHYNDSVAATRRLKLNLHDPADVNACLQELADRWPAQARRFQLLYAEALDLVPVRSLMKRETAPC